MTELNDQNPWAKITKDVNSLRVDPEGPWNFFWAQDIDGKCRLVLNHTPVSSKGVRLPNLKNIDVSVTKIDDARSALILRLDEPSNQDIFYRLSMDIIEKSATATTEVDAVRYAVDRTWRWHHLLRGGLKKLSIEEQKGLIGELVVLQEIILKNLSVKDSVDSWIGPDNAPKDFQFGGIAIEAKARRGGSTPSVSISSANQLDDTGVNHLFLHVVDLDRQASSAVNSFTVSDIAEQVRRTIAEYDQSSMHEYEAKLTSAGFNDEDDYSDTQWMLGGRHLYRITDRFPRITTNELWSGVINVSYSVLLKECEPFRCDRRTIDTLLEAQ